VTPYQTARLSGPRGGRPPAGAATAAPQLFVEVVDANAQPIYLSTKAFQSVAGQVAYQNIVLPAGEKPIGDPPPEIRNIAVPSRKKKP